MRILVTGGTGYIGAHVVTALRDRGDDVVIVDDAVTGVVGRVPGITLERLDLADAGAVDVLTELIAGHNIDAVVHFAARKQVGESVTRPIWYYQQNLTGLANLLEAMQQGGVGRFVFSSSAAVYGNANGQVDEDSLTAPINPYGETKLAGEWLTAAATRSFDLDAVSLRYFNVAGAASPALGDRAVLNLVPMMFERLDRREPPLIFGDDYETPDGTCVRDYVHVVDLAEAHLAALDSLDGGTRRHRVYNVGTGRGTSVREMVEIIGEVSGIRVDPSVVDRRQGDPAQVVATVDRIAAELGWTARHSVRDIVESAWLAHTQA